MSIAHKMKKEKWKFSRKPRKSRDSEIVESVDNVDKTKEIIMVNKRKTP